MHAHQRAVPRPQINPGFYSIRAGGGWCVLLRRDNGGDSDIFTAVNVGEPRRLVGGTRDGGLGHRVPSPDQSSGESTRIARRENQFKPNLTYWRKGVGV